MSYLQSRPILYAHRGAAAERPENTMPSFARALEIGADALEMDVHMTRDGHLVVCHDPTGLRMTGVDAMYRDVTLSEVKSWDAGHGFIDEAGQRPFVGKGISIPTFEEVLVEFSGVPLNVDLKQPSPPIVDPFIDLVRRTGNCDRVTVASFHESTIRACRQRDYEGPTALSRLGVIAVHTVPQRLWKFVRQRFGSGSLAAQIPTHSGPIRMDTQKFVDKCHALGMRVDYWTINDIASARRLLRPRRRWHHDRRSSSARLAIRRPLSARAPVLKTRQQPEKSSVLYH